MMDGSEGKLRLTWQFYVEQFLWRDASQKGRSFDIDRPYFDHFNIRPSPVRAVVAACHADSMHPLTVTRSWVADVGGWHGRDEELQPAERGDDAS
jgi:hypothetical protein